MGHFNCPLSRVVSVLLMPLQIQDSGAQSMSLKAELLQGVGKQQHAVFVCQVAPLDLWSQVLCWCIGYERGV